MRLFVRSHFTHNLTYTYNNPEGSPAAATGDEAECCALSAGVAVEPSGEALPGQLPSDHCPSGWGWGGVSAGPAGAPRGETAVGIGGEEHNVQPVSVLLLSLNIITETGRVELFCNSNVNKSFRLLLLLLSENSVFYLKQVISGQAVHLHCNTLQNSLCWPEVLTHVGWFTCCMYKLFPPAFPVLCPYLSSLGCAGLYMAVCGHSFRTSTKRWASDTSGGAPTATKHYSAVWASTHGTL